MARIIFFLIDGLADPVSLKTPLKIAKKENLKRVLKNSFLAEFYLFKKDTWPKQGSGSLTGLANLRILGYELKPNEVKRGPLEAVGAEVDYQQGELALRVDFATVDKDLKVLDRRAGRNLFGLVELEKAINSIPFEIPFHFHRTYGHRGVLIFKAKLSENISDADPYENFKKVRKIKPLKKDPLSQKTAKIIQEFLDRAHHVLDHHPFNKLREEKKIPKANYLLTREAGTQLPKLENFFKKTKFKNGLVIAENGVVKGGCLLVGFKALTLPEIENLWERYNFIKNALLENFKKYDLIYLHLKEADEASHDKDFKRKKMFFEFFDRWFGKLRKNLPQETIYILTGDHLTETKTGKHRYGPIPILIINGPKTNQPQEFSEIEAKRMKIKLTPQDLWKML